MVLERRLSAPYYYSACRFRCHDQPSCAALMSRFVAIVGHYFDRPTNPLLVAADIDSAERIAFAANCTFSDVWVPFEVWLFCNALEKPPESNFKSTLSVAKF
jgi:hypothetical protein